MLIIGVTGGIGSGKTAVTNAFSTHGIDIVDADIAARTVVEKGSAGLQQIREHFGSDILLGNGTLNRAKLREIIFKDADAKKWLEQLTHPLIRQEIISGLQKSNSPYTILVSPLLIESGQHQLVNRVLVVDVPVELQVQRACERDDNAQAQVEAIIASQLDRNKRLSFADDIIVNDKTLEHLQQQVAQLNQQYVRLSEEHHES
ncbi:MAG: dephospho-CoA kinase [Oceanicoccus sp.]|jgi:dephospho-CoA kinase